MSKNDVNTRNAKAKDFVDRKLNEAKSYKSLNNKINNELVKLISEFVDISQMGFRGIVLTAIVGKYLDNEFDPTKEFYKCNPRSIFENGIRLSLNANLIPCGKSDPLNVAKNENTIDMNWAKGKRPEKAAIAVVEFLKSFQKLDFQSNEAQNMINLFFQGLLKLKNKIQDIETLHPDIFSSKLLIAEKISNLVYNCPEGGTIPQFIFGTLLFYMRKSRNCPAVSGNSLAV